MKWPLYVCSNATPDISGKEKHMSANEPKVVDVDPEKLVEVSISTTAGFYPAEGYDQVPVDEKVELQLEKAARDLDIKPTSDWIANVNGPEGLREIDPMKAYMENKLSGQVDIDWGPKEGGGG